MMKNTNNKKQITTARELQVCERTLNKWKPTAWNIVQIFEEYSDRSFSLKLFRDIIRTWHLNTPGSKYSESAIRGVLARFLKKGYLESFKSGGKKITTYYKLTPAGRKFFKKAMDYYRFDSSHTQRPLRRVLKGNSSHGVAGEEGYQVELALRPWREKIGFDSGWKENSRITKVWLDPFIIKNIRTAIGEEPIGRNRAKWMSVHSDSFKMQVSKIRTIQLWVHGPNWQKELSEWLQTVPNLQEHHMDLIWNKILERAKEIVVTREFHVTDPDLAKSNIYLFRGSGSWNWSAKDLNEVCQVPRRTRSRIHRDLERRRQCMCESRRTICSCSNVSAHLRKGTEQSNRSNGAEVCNKIGGVQEITRIQCRETIGPSRTTEFATHEFGSETLGRPTAAAIEGGF